MKRFKLKDMIDWRHTNRMKSFKMSLLPKHAVGKYGSMRKKAGDESANYSSSDHWHTGEGTLEEKILTGLNIIFKKLRTDTVSGLFSGLKFEALF